MDKTLTLDECIEVAWQKVMQEDVCRATPWYKQGAKIDVTVGTDKPTLVLDNSTDGAVPSLGEDTASTVDVRSDSR